MRSCCRVRLDHEGIPHPGRPRGDPRHAGRRRKRADGAEPVNVIVFTGPTLSARDVAAVIEAECRPPAAAGDVYRATLQYPTMIAIVDGYFERIPSVWHK